MNIIKSQYVCLLILIFVNISCSNKEKTQKFHRLNYRDSFDIDVQSIQNKKNVLVLNDTFIIGKKCKLIFEEYNPKWLFEETNQRELINGEYVFSPKIFEIKIPFKLKKAKESNVFNLIKNQDTLEYYLELEDEMQLDLYY